MSGDLTLRQLQTELAPWEKWNFGDRPDWYPLLGAVEELGELAHSFLKRHEGIRGTPEEHITNEKDAVADTIIFLADFCTARGYDMQALLEATWASVQHRNWREPVPQHEHTDGLPINWCCVETRS